MVLIPGFSLINDHLAIAGYQFIKALFISSRSQLCLNVDYWFSDSLLTPDNQTSDQRRGTLEISPITLNPNLLTKFQRASKPNTLTTLLKVTVDHTTVVAHTSNPCPSQSTP